MACKICGETEISNFYVSNYSKCKQCTKDSVNKRRAEKIEQIREYDRNRKNAKERVLKNKERLEKYKTQNKDKYDEYCKSKNEWAKNNRIKRNAHNKVSRALLKGIIKRPTDCQVCGDITKIEAHHDDYEKPLDVMWLCVPCHNERHKVLKTKQLVSKSNKKTNLKIDLA